MARLLPPVALETVAERIEAPPLLALPEVKVEGEGGSLAWRPLTMGTTSSDDPELTIVDAAEGGGASGSGAAEKALSVERSRGVDSFSASAKDVKSVCCGGLLAKLDALVSCEIGCSKCADARA